jgi:hypothetical protein
MVAHVVRCHIHGRDIDTVSSLSTVYLVGTLKM